MRKIILLTLIFIAATFRLPAQSEEYRTGRLFDDPVAVAGNYTGFCQDKDGFIWIGTNRGLLRFDGNAYDIYRHENNGEGSLSDSRVLDVFCDSEGHVWVATANGLNLYNPDNGRFQTVSLPGKTFYGYINAVNQQADGIVVFMASGVGLYKIKFVDDNPEAVKYSYQESNIDISNNFNAIACCRDGSMYFGMHDGMVYKLDKNGILSSISVSPGSYIMALSLEDDGNLLVATINALYRINAATSHVARLSIDENISVNNLSNAANDIIYVGTSDGGLWKVSSASDKAVPASEIYCPFVNLRTANVGAVYSAPDGNLWIGCNHKGIVLVPGQPMPFTYKKMSDDFPDFTGGISAISQWKDNVVAALGQGTIVVFSSNGNLSKIYKFPFHTLITSIEVMDDDKALLGVVGDGVWQLDLKSGAFVKCFDVPGKYPLIDLEKGIGEDLYVGVHGEGVMRYNLKTGQQEWLPYKAGSETGFSNPFITSLLHSPDDKMWICTYSGLACYDLRTNKMLEVDQMPFLNGSTFAAAPAGDSAVIAGTSQGLIIYDLKKGVVKKYTIAEGLTDNDVRSLVSDGNGGFWIGTVRGLSYLPADSDKLQSYYGGYGLVENVFNQGIYSKANDRVYFGNNLGFTSFRPGTVPMPGFQQKVRISAIYLNGKQLDRKSEDDKKEIMTGSAVLPESINLPFKDNALTLRMSTMDYRDASNISYMWRLKRKDDWSILAPGQNMIYLPHLDPGVYDFEVCAIENNVMSESTHIKIYVAHPWYWNAWTKTLFAIIVLCLLWLVWMAYKKKRDEKINDEKIKFFMDISHDLRSPLTLVLSPLESLIKKENDDDTKSKLKTMHRNVLRMLSLVNQLLDIRKLEKGKMHLHCKPTDVNSFVGELVEMFRPQAEEKKQTIRFVGWDKTEKIWLDRNNFDKILVNLISNAIKYTPEGGEIMVKASKEDDAKLGNCLGVRVTDTGIGLDAKTQARLFERFYRTETAENQSSKGFGIGLDLCRRLVKLHHGSISGGNREDGVKGSIFRVLIPIDEKIYGEEELKTPTELDKTHIRSIPSVPSGNEPEEPSFSGSAGNKYLMIVDDDPELKAYIAGQLGKLYRVRSASNGAEALKLLGEKTPDLIISDIKMPEMDGLTFLKRLKSNTDTNHIPVILLSSKTSLADRMSGWEKGADAYIDKPFDMEELKMIVGTLIGNRQRMKGKYTGSQDPEGKISAPEMKGNDEILMQRILKEINEHIEDPDFNVERMASEVGVSRAHLHRKMKDLVGMTPSDYIRNIRLKRACELLQRGDIEVTQVAYKIGFTSQSHFSSHFKRYTGFSPSEYRDKNKI